MDQFPAIVALLIARTEHFLGLVWERLTGTLVSPYADLSVITLGFSLLLAVLWVSRGRRRPFKVLGRALFPRRWLAGPSARADIAFTLFNRFIAGSLVAWAIVSGAAIGSGIELTLTQLFGPMQAGSAQTGSAHGWPVVALATLVLFLAYEAGYYVDHYLSHRIAWLWQFHRTHHLAETLSPLTAYRVHPVDTIVFYNIIGLSTGAAIGVLSYLLPGAQAVEIEGSNVLVIVALYFTTHLQHSHIWLPLTGTAGKIIMSPAHHQLHHSDNPDHYDCNFGSNLALFDWLAGTLHMPTKERQKLHFGAGEYPVDPHSVSGALVQPFIEAARPLFEGTKARPAELKTQSGI